MRTLAALGLVLAACSAAPTPVAAPGTSVAGPSAPAESATPAPGPVDPPVESIAADTPRTTVAGNAFVAPAAWTLRVRGADTILEAPEGGSFVAIYDLAEAKDADDAVAQAWAAYQGKAPYPLITSVAAADDDGWRKIRRYRTLSARDGQHEYVFVEAG